MRLRLGYEPGHDPGGRGAHREAWIDRARGLAIVLMVLDHGLAVWAPGHIARYTLTRLSLPLFMLAAAAAHRRSGGSPTPRRIAQVCAAAAVEATLVAQLGFPTPGIVALIAAWLVALRLFPAITNYAYWLAVAGLIQAVYRPVDWTGYQPGLVVAWWCLAWGYTAVGGDELERLPGQLERVGRAPLRWYLGHLGVLAVVA